MSMNPSKDTGESPSGGKHPLVEACTSGDLKKVRSLAAGQISDAIRQQALQAAAEFGRTACFSAVAETTPEITSDTLEHVVRWALRYNHEDILALAMKSDEGKWKLPQAHLAQLHAHEERKLRPNAVLLYVLKRLRAAEETHG